MIANHIATQVAMENSRKSHNVRLMSVALNTAFAASLKSSVERKKSNDHHALPVAAWIEWSDTMKDGQLTDLVMLSFPKRSH